MNFVKIDGIEYNLTDLEKDCWVRLLNGSLKGRDSFHSPTIANIGKKGINMRTVILRKVNTTEKLLTFHTDIRSGKWQELQNNNSVSWLFYDAASKFQIRLAGKATLHHNDIIANESWQKTSANSRKTYMTTLAPSLQSETPTSGLLSAFEAVNPTIEETEIYKKNFAVVVTQIYWMEWLWLSSKGHRRASFNYAENNKFEASWLVP